MKILLLRHADAEDVAKTDAERRLTEKGHRQADSVGNFLHRNGVAIDVILTSPYQRARQTAKAVHAKVGAARLVEDPRIGCGMTAATAMEIFRDHSSAETVLIVGHQPDLTELAAHLLSKDGSLAADFRKASLLTLELGSLKAGSGILQSFVLVKQMA